MTAAVRLPDWEPRLHAYLASVSTRLHVYGEHDCALFVAGAVEAMTGVDFAAPFRGRYSTALGGARVLKSQGSGTLPELLTASLERSGPLAFAHRGDVCLYGEAAGILMSNHGLFVGRDAGDPETFGVGLVRVPRHLLVCETAWPVRFD